MSGGPCNTARRQHKGLDWGVIHYTELRSVVVVTRGLHVAQLCPGQLNLARPVDSSWRCPVRTGQVESA